MTIAKSRVIFAVFFILVGLAAVAQADTLSSIMGAPYAAGDGPGYNYAHAPTYGANPIPARITAIEYPVLGMPEIVEPAGVLNVVVYDVNGDEYPDPADWQVRLTTAYAYPDASYAHVGDPVAQNYDAVVSDVAYDATLKAYRLTCAVPDGAPADVYGLAVTCATIVDYQPAAVAIRDTIGGTYTFAHLSDIQLADLAGYSTGNEETSGDYPGATTEQRSVAIFQNEILSELALLRPDFAVITGGLSDGDNYQTDIATLAQILASTKTPLFLAPGNHDGYAYYGSTTVLTDGLESYGQSWGPLYYSFDYGSLHFAVANSYDGSTARRQGIALGVFAVLAENAGGFMGPAQYGWLQADLAAATHAGQRTMLFMNHDPRGPYSADMPFSTNPSDHAEQYWNFDSSAWDSDPTDGIQNETAKSNTGTKLLTAALQADVPFLFIGHSHWDSVWQYAAGAPILDRDNNVLDVPLPQQPFNVVQTTTAAAGVASGTGKREYNGYRLISVENNAVTSLNAIDPASPERSVPAGNLWFTPTNNDGTSTYAQIQVTNGLPAALPITLQFFVAGLPQGYEIVNEKTGDLVPITDLGLGDNGVAVLYAKTTVNGVDPAAFPVPAGKQVQAHFAARPLPTGAAPTAAFSVTPATPPTSFNFDASASTNPGGGSLRCFWDFGDGFTGAGKTIAHTYTLGGELVVTLTVMNQTGGSATTQSTLGVSDCCPDRKHKIDHFGCGECDAAGPGSPWSGLASMLVAALALFLLRFVLVQRRGK